MKRRGLALLLAALLVLALAAGPAAAADKLSFVSINDTLPPELINCAVTYNSTTYVPYYVFSNYGLGLSYSFFPSVATAALYTADAQLYFDVTTGVTYDGDDYRYSVSAIIRNGTVYVPLSFVCRFFGFISVSNLNGNEYGSVLRLTNGSEVLTDTEFLRAAESAMGIYSRQYRESLVTETPQPSATPTLAPDHGGEHVALSMAGLPSALLLRELAASKTLLTVFLTADEVRADPDTVRRLVCEGHTLGVYCTGDLAAEYPETAALLFEAARVKTVLVAAPADYAEECAARAADAGLVFCRAALDTAGRDTLNDYQLTLLISAAEGGTSVRFSAADADALLPGTLRYLLREGYTLTHPTEAG